FITIDTETTGLNIHKGHRPFLYVAKRSWEPGVLVTNDWREFRSYIGHRQDIPKVFHNAQFDLAMVGAVYDGLGIPGMTLPGAYCTMVMKHLIDAGHGGNSLDACSKKYLPEHLQKKVDLVEDWFRENGIKKKDRHYDQVPADIMLEYARYDVIATEALFKLFWPVIMERGQLPLLQMEMEFVRTMIKINARGIPLNVSYLEDLKAEYEVLIDVSKAKMVEMIGPDINLNSAKQIGEFLSFEGYELPKTPKGNYIINKAELKKHTHPLLVEMVNYSKLTDTMSNFIEGLLKSHIDGFIYPNLRNTTTIHGRLSCVDPNLQKIPKKDKSIRRAFPPWPGYVSFYLDYKQQEYRVFADFANEIELIRKINEEDADFHKMIMEEFDQYFHGNRDPVKTFNFMLIYGGGYAALAEKLGIPVKEAKDLKRDYFSRFTNVKSFFDDIKKEAIREGFVTNKFGRRNYLPRDKWGGTQEYKLVNYQISGSCADYVKMVMNKLEMYFKDKPQMVLLQVHDELRIDTPIGDYDWIPDVVTIMEDSLEFFKVKLGVDVSVAFDNWSEKLAWDVKNQCVKEIKIEESYTGSDDPFEDEGEIEEW
ncbi:MAG: DNA polymerase, partial [Bacteroidia bacterium]|nr:DNA polymerase [Bacteroidia bacterium]